MDVGESSPQHIEEEMELIDTNQQQLQLRIDNEEECNL